MCVAIHSSVNCKLPCCSSTIDTSEQASQNLKGNGVACRYRAEVCIVCAQIFLLLCFENEDKN